MLPLSISIRRCFRQLKAIAKGLNDWAFLALIIPFIYILNIPVHAEGRVEALRNRERQLRLIRDLKMVLYEDLHEARANDPQTGESCLCRICEMIRREREEEEEEEEEGPVYYVGGLVIRLW
jgi:hypothetical protein